MRRNRLPGLRRSLFLISLTSLFIFSLIASGGCSRGRQKRVSPEVSERQEQIARETTRPAQVREKRTTGESEVPLSVSEEELPIQSDASWEELRDIGLGHLEKGDAREAIRYFTASIRLNDSEPLTFLYRARARLAAGDESRDSSYVDLAVRDINTALQLDPALVEGYVERAALRTRLGLHNGDMELVESGIEDYDKAIELEPKAARILLARGKAKKALGSLRGELALVERSIVDFNAAVRLDPNMGEAYLQRGHALGLLYERFGYKVEYLRRALSDFEKACQGGLREGCRYQELTAGLLNSVVREEGELLSSLEGRVGVKEGGSPAAEPAVGEKETEERATAEVKEESVTIFMVIAKEMGEAAEIKRMLEEGEEVEQVSTLYPGLGEVMDVNPSQLREVFRNELSLLLPGETSSVIQEGGLYYLMHRIR